MALAERMVAAVDEAPDDAPPEMQALAREARAALKAIKDILAAPTDAVAAPTESRAA